MLPHPSPNIVMGFYFSPRGGSAQVVRYLCRALLRIGWLPRLVAGSLGGPAETSNGRRFFRGIRCRTVDYTAASARWAAGADAMDATVPMHASYEDKADVPDRIFVDLDEDAFHRQTASWARIFATHRDRPDLLHLHHLTPMHEAARSRWPDVPIITHLHGTELKMLVAARDGTIPDAPARWTSAWVLRMQRWAAESDQIIVVSEQDRRLAGDLLRVDDDRICVMPNGVDTDLFSPTRPSDATRLALWRRLLVEDPQGWRPGRPPGSIRYDERDLAAFTRDDGTPTPVVLFAGRFLGFKRVQLLIEAHDAALTSGASSSVLVIAGGFPGEWEGEHPVDTVRRLRARNVFFVGWRDHAQLAEILRCCHVFAAPAVDEPFGLVYLEAMAAGLPVLATATGGPPTFINTLPNHPNGWLVPPDDAEATAQALTAAIADPGDRARRGEAATAFVHDRYSWKTAAGSFTTLYEKIVDRPSSGSRCTIV